MYRDVLILGGLNVRVYEVASVKGLVTRVIMSSNPLQVSQVSRVARKHPLHGPAEHIHPDCIVSLLSCKSVSTKFCVQTSCLVKNGRNRVGHTVVVVVWIMKERSAGDFDSTDLACHWTITVHLKI